MMLRKKVIFNIILAIVACCLSVVLYFVFQSEIIPTTGFYGLYEKNGKKNLQVKLAQKTVGKVPVEIVYESIIENNIFSPERREYVEDIPEKITNEVKFDDIKISGKYVELYGVTRIDKKYWGMIFHPEFKTKKNYKWVEVGDRIADFTIVDIFPDKLILQDEKKKYVIKLLEKRKPGRSSVSRKVEKPTIVSTRGGAKRKRIHSVDKAQNKRTSTKKKPKIIHTPFGDIIRK